MSDINDIITSEIADNDVVLFMKGTPVFPQCGFSSQVVQILSYLGVSFKGVNVLDNDELREGIKTSLTGQPSLNFMSKGSFWAAVILSVKCLKKTSYANSSQKTA